MNTKTESKHTPGPWMAGKQVIEDELNVPYVSIRQGQKHIAQVTYGMPPEMFANARLIAAAPELLEALDEIEGLPVNDDGERIIPPGFLDKARYAIAKATQP
jgi:hypothetical protein